MSTLSDSLHSPLFQRALVESILVGAVAGVVGVHVLLRRLPFFVVALSHATFPGVVLASVFGVSILIGGWVAGVAVVVAVVVLGRMDVLDETSVIGVVLAGAFALGVLVQSARPGGSKDLSAFLVGSILTVTRGDIVVTAVVVAIVIAVIALINKELVLSAFDATGARAVGYPTTALDALALVIVTVVLVTAVPAVGTLLAVALLTIPALAARQWVDRVGPAMVLGGGMGAVAAVVGLCVSAVWRIAAGGAIALVASTLFAVSAAARALVMGERVQH